MLDKYNFEGYNLGVLLRSESMTSDNGMIYVSEMAFIGLDIISKTFRIVWGESQEKYF